uniref:Uncharacterized protein n=1 Tax=Rhizophora mucronata TaxID=61149 RepID=A0A2P2JM07_RHIMU
MKMHSKVESRENHRDRLLYSIHSFERPFAMVFDRTVTKYFSFFFSVNHTIVVAITLATPFFPLQVKRFLDVPWTITRCTI